jgi:hypothetical protein
MAAAASSPKPPEGGARRARLDAGEPAIQALSQHSKTIIILAQETSAGFMVLFAVGSCRRMMGIRAGRPSNVRCAISKEPQTKFRNGLAHAPAGTFLDRIRRTDAKFNWISASRGLQMGTAVD